MRRLALFLTVLFASPAAACGPDTDCMIGERSYRLYLPENLGPDPVGAVVFAHGYRGSAEGVMRNRSLRGLADELGMVFVALKSAGDDWNLAHRPRNPAQTEALEYTYVAAVLDDVAARVALDRDRVVATGFSAGGMMTWTLACGMPGQFAGFVPISGTFWAPVPETCSAAPANLVHIHGTQDSVVPLGGRQIGEARQGDVPTALATYAAHGAFSYTETVQAPGDMMCRQSENAAGQVLDFCTFPGGHDFSVTRLRHGIARVLGH
ncbi:alpha/beta hydrolase family esterase [Rhodophyticola porphyridii]|uniref:Polyhydroxybutyrate depolymerase n=1 Tax=Rhodophyticola porphyridii TaxID=1852017 RepID=A0A3L9Y3V8_9RHOB|nr:PHB depolymerase family esterase [Rhodophyticola porphyridii]RMA43439.1 polyhydroxybutyrate depolymerase [Rhodophyticola porphyridii]